MSDAASREETLFNVARQLSHPQDRVAYLADACGNDRALRERIERLLQAEHHANEFLANDPLDLKRAGESTCAGAYSGTQSVAMTTVAPAPGDVIEDYEILEKIGGNMGLVFKARHRLLDKIVVLKLLPAESIADPARLARFQRELRVMGQLEHPNLVPAADARVVDCWHLVAMELIDGMDLHRLVETQGSLPIAAACEVARQTAVALQYAHQHGLIHRDIKPSNLMLTHAGTVKVIDMGLALIQEESTAQLTQEGLLLGTMSYCAPEQFRDASRVDIRADIYSLGCTLYCLLTGKPPYWPRKTIAEVMQAHLQEDFPSLVQARPDAPPGIVTVLARMTAKDPAARFATPGEVAEALAPFACGADLKRLLPARTPQLSGRGSGNGGKRPEAGSRKPAQDVATARASATAQILVGPVRPDETVASPEAQRSAVAGERRWKRMAAVLVLVIAVVGAVIFSVARSKEDGRANGNRAVVLMDTTAPKGIYDPDNHDTGRSNADELYKGLTGLDGILLASDLHKEGIGADWARESFVIALKPNLIIIHRSSFFHPLAARIKLPYPPFANAEDHKSWQNIYDAQDLRLRGFISLVGSAVPQCQFLIYSRGTDTNWLNPIFRSNWTATLESDFANLQGRINTMVIPDQPNGEKGTFRDPATMEEVRRHVREMLKFPRKQQP